MERNQIFFSANLRRLMMLRGLRSSDVAEKVGVTRQMVSLWRLGSSMPSVERERVLAHALKCRVAELFQPNTGTLPALMPISQWAIREGIPIGRAKNLFKYGVLSGDIGGNVHLVPIGLHAPVDSRQAIQEARKPERMHFLSINLDKRMRALGMSNQTLADATEVKQAAVAHWRSGRSIPPDHRLPMITKKLKCTINDLMVEPNERDIADWTFRYNRARPVHLRREAA